MTLGEPVTPESLNPQTTKAPTLGAPMSLGKPIDPLAEDTPIEVYADWKKQQPDPSIAEQVGDAAVHFGKGLYAATTTIISQGLKTARAVVDPSQSVDDKMKTFGEDAALAAEVAADAYKGFATTGAYVASKAKQASNAMAAAETEDPKVKEELRIASLKAERSFMRTARDLAASSNDGRVIASNIFNTLAEKTGADKLGGWETLNLNDFKVNEAGAEFLAMLVDPELGAQAVAKIGLKKFVTREAVAAAARHDLPYEGIMAQAQTKALEAAKNVAEHEADMNAIRAAGGIVPHDMVLQHDVLMRKSAEASSYFRLVTEKLETQQAALEMEKQTALMEKSMGRSATQKVVGAGVRLAGQATTKAGELVGKVADTLDTAVTHLASGDEVGRAAVESAAKKAVPGYGTLATTEGILKGTGRFFTEAGRQMAERESSLPYFQSLSRALPEGSIGRWVASQGERVEFLSNAGRWVMDSADAGIRGTGVGAAFGTLNGDPVGGATQGALFGMTGSQYGMWRRMNSPEQVWMQQRVDIAKAAARREGMPNNQSEMFARMTENQRLVVATMEQAHPDMMFNFVREGGKGVAGWYDYNGKVGVVNIDLDHPTPFAGLVQHEVKHHLAKNPEIAQTIETKLLGDPTSGVAGVFTARDAEGRPIVRDLPDANSPGLVRREFDLSPEFYERRKEYLDKLKASGAPTTEYERSNKLIAHEIWAETQTANLLGRQANGRFDMIANERMGAVQKMLSDVVAGSDLVANSAFLQKTLGKFGVVFNSFDGKAANTNLFSKDTSVPEIKSLLERYYRMSDRERAAAGDPEQRDVRQYSEAEILRSPELSEMFSAGFDTVRDPLSGKVRFVSEKEAKARAKDFFDTLTTELDRYVGNEKGVVRKQTITDANGRTQEVWMGTKVPDSVIQRMRESGRFNEINLTNLKVMSDLMSLGLGNEVNFNYQPASSRGSRLYRTRPITERTETPMTIRITKDANVVINTVSQEKLIRNAVDAVKAGRAELWGNDFESLWKDINVYLNNHANGESGAANGLGMEKRDFINSLFGQMTKDQREANPFLQDISERQARNMGIVQSRRLDRLSKPVTLSTTFKPDYPSFARNYSPADIIPVPERFTGSGTEVDRQSTRVPEEKIPGVFRKFNIDEYTKGGAYFDLKTGEDITGKVYESGAIDVSNGRPSLGTSDQTAEPSTTGRNIKTNLFKQTAGWKWVGEAPSKTSTLVSVETGKDHFYTLNSTFSTPVEMARYENAKSEPRLRPTTKGYLQFGEKVGEIDIRGKVHPVYDRITTTAEEPSGTQYSPGSKQTSTPEFKEWFRKSRTIDEEGNVMPMYHGTFAEDFTVFKPNRDGLIFVSPDPKVANTFAGAEYSDAEARDYTPKRSRVYKVYARAENPFDYENPQHIQDLFGDAKQLKLSDFTTISRREVEKGNWGAIEDAAPQINALGYDSLYVKEGGVKNLGLFDPNQLKSATGNNGQFSTTNNDIRYAPGKTPAQHIQDIRDIDNAGNKTLSQANPAAIKYPQNPVADSVTLVPRWGMVNRNIVGMPRSFSEVHDIVSRGVDRLSKMVKDNPSFAKDAARFYVDMAESSRALAEVVAPGVKDWELHNVSDLMLRYLALGSPRTDVSANATKSSGSASAYASEFEAGKGLGFGPAQLGAKETYNAWSKGDHFNLDAPGIDDKVRSFYINGISELIEMLQNEGDTASADKLMIRAGRSMHLIPDTAKSMTAAERADILRHLDGKATVDMWDMAAKGFAWPGFILRKSERNKATQPFQWSQDKFSKSSSMAENAWQTVMKDLGIDSAADLTYQQARALQIEGNKDWSEKTWKQRLGSLPDQIRDAETEVAAAEAWRDEAQIAAAKKARSTAKNDLRKERNKTEPDEKKIAALEAVVAKTEKAVIEASDIRDTKRIDDAKAALAKLHKDAFAPTTEFTYYSQGTEAGLSPGGAGPMYDAQQGIDGLIADRMNELGMAPMFGKEKLKARNAQEILWALEKLDNPIEANNDLSLFGNTFKTLRDHVDFLRLGGDVASLSKKSRTIAVLDAMDRAYAEMARQTMPIEVDTKGTSANAKITQDKIAALRAVGDTDPVGTVTRAVADGLHDEINDLAIKHNLDVTVDSITVSRGGYTENNAAAVAPNMLIRLRGAVAAVRSLLDVMSRAMDQDGGNILRKPTVTEINDPNVSLNTVVTFDTRGLSEPQREAFFMDLSNLKDAKGDSFLTGFTETTDGMAIGDQFYNGSMADAMLANEAAIKGLLQKHNVQGYRSDRLVIDTFDRNGGGRWNRPRKFGAEDGTETPARGTPEADISTTQFAKDVTDAIHNRIKNAQPQSRQFPQVTDPAKQITKKTVVGAKEMETSKITRRKEIESQLKSLVDGAVLRGDIDEATAGKLKDAIPKAE